MTEEALDEVELTKDKEIIDKISSKLFPVLHKKDEINIINELDKKEYSDIDLTLCIDTAHNDNTILTTLVSYNLTRAVTYFISIVKSYKKLFQEYLAYINKKNSKGYNALLYSAFRGNLTIFTKLMECGADINSANSNGLNALHLASQGNYPNIIIYLIEKYGMDINSIDNNGNSALHWAIYMNRPQAVDYLIYYKIDINLRDNNNETALDIARIKDNNFLIKKFEEDYFLLYNKPEEGKISQDKNELNSKKNSLVLILKSFFNEIIGNEHSRNSYAYPFLFFIIFIELFNQIIIIRGYKNYFMSMVFTISFIILLFFYITASKSDAGEILSKCINSLVLLAEQGEDMKNICPWCINYTNLYMSFFFFFVINFCFKLIISIWGIFWLKNVNFTRTIGFIIPQILLVSCGIALGVIKIRKNSKLSYEMNFGNLFIKDIKDNNNNDNETNITINNTIEKNTNIQLTTLGNTN